MVDAFANPVGGRIAVEKGYLKEVGPFNDPAVSDGCPGGFIGLPDESLLRSRAPLVEGPVESDFTVHVLVVEDAAMAEYPAGSLGYFPMPYSFRCEEHVCAEASTALFVSATVAGAPDSLDRALQTAAGWDTFLNPVKTPGGKPSEK